MTKKKNLQANTRLIHAGINDEKIQGSVTPPIYLSSTFSLEGYEKKRTYDYTRSGNPTRDTLGAAIADLENGAGGVVTASGMAAINLIIQLLEPGDTVISTHDCYGGTFRLLDALEKKGNIKAVFADLTDTDNLSSIFSCKPKLILVETPSNPLLRITDIEAVIREAKKAGALVAFDNTFLSPVLQKPLDWGADIVLHSTTKYINGHSDVVGGAIVAKTQELYEKLAWWANCIGCTGAPFDSFLTLRGMRTLEVRIKQQCENAEKIAAALANNSKVQKVYFPGLTDHPGHSLAQKQQERFGAMISFELKGGIESVRRCLDSIEIFTLAESLGGYESLINHPTSMTHASMTPEVRQKAGIDDGLLRLSIGIESADDLIEDLEQAIKSCA